jgi:hypothetical protein
VTQDLWLTETYFDWLRQECFQEREQRREYEGVLRTLHDIPFYWTMWSDENRAGDALAFRQSDFLGFQKDLDRLDQHWLNAWGQQAPSVLEVLLGMARRWSFYFEGHSSYYFYHMFHNMTFDRFPGRVLPSDAQSRIRDLCDDWMARQFQPNGRGSPFPVTHALDVVDMRQVDIWGQMNAYSAEHFQ